MTVKPAEDRPTEAEVVMQAEDSSSSGGAGSLRQRVLRGGVFLAIREGVGILAGLVGGVLLARLIGPHQYGLFFALVAFFGYLQNVATLGINAFLVRTEGALD